MASHVRVTISRDGCEVADVPMVQLLAALGIPYSEETAEAVARELAEQQRVDRLFASL